VDQQPPHEREKAVFPCATKGAASLFTTTYGRILKNPWILLAPLMLRSDASFALIVAIRSLSSSIWRILFVVENLNSTLSGKVYHQRMTEW